MNRKSRFSIAGFICLTAALAFAGQLNPAGSDKSKKPINKIIHLSAGTAEPKATGIAKAFSKSKGKKPFQTFQVVGANLTAGMIYTLFVDGIEIDSRMASANDDDDAQSSQGEDSETEVGVEFKYSSKAKMNEEDDDEGLKPLPPSLNPVTNIRLVELKNSKGEVVLSGNFR